MMSSVVQGVVLGFALTVVSAGNAAAQGAPGAPVRVEETPEAFILSNDVVRARVSKASGDLVSLAYKGVETLTGISGHPFVYWSHDVRGGVRIETAITIDPADNGGARGEVSVRGVSGGRSMGFGPGTPPEGDLPIDVEIRYALERGDAGIYTYSVFEHRPEYGAGDMMEARIAAKLQPWFETILVDEARHGTYPLPIETPDKYVYAANQHANRAYGFASEERGLGWFMILPSAEFLSGGPTKPELLAHGEIPTVLSYWRSSHYGGAVLEVEEGEHWTRVVGPLLLYVNEGSSAEAMWDDARRRLAREEERWPYDWVVAEGYATRSERSEVAGRLVLDACVAGPGSRFEGDIHVGLTKTPYEVTGADGASRTVTWQEDAKHLQHWATSTDGRFTIPDVPAGTYTLSAFARGILDPFARADIEVPGGGGSVDLGDLTWSPRRYGRTVWEIGVADRSPMEFAGAENHFRPGQPLRYGARFPDDIQFEVGESDPSVDWFYAHTAHVNETDAAIVPFRGVSGRGRAAPRSVHFELAEAPRGRAALRIAVTGTGGTPRLNVSVNGTPVEQLHFGRNDGALTRHQANGIWRSRDVVFDAALLREGANTITITAPAGPLNSGVIYDYLRLELETPGC